VRAHPRLSRVGRAQYSGPEEGDQVVRSGFEFMFLVASSSRDFAPMNQEGRTELATGNSNANPEGKLLITFFRAAVPSSDDGRQR
jgi:hypothetical protein